MTCAGLLPNGHTRHFNSHWLASKKLIAPDLRGVDCSRAPCVSRMSFSVPDTKLVKTCNVRLTPENCPASRGAYNNAVIQLTNRRNEFRATQRGATATGRATSRERSQGPSQVPGHARNVSKSSQTSLGGGMSAYSAGQHASRSGTFSPRHDTGSGTPSRARTLSPTGSTGHESAGYSPQQQQGSPYTRPYSKSPPASGPYSGQPGQYPPQGVNPFDTAHSGSYPGYQSSFSGYRGASPGSTHQTYGARMSSPPRGLDPTSQQSAHTSPQGPHHYPAQIFQAYPQDQGHQQSFGDPRAPQPGHYPQDPQAPAQDYGQEYHPQSDFPGQMQHQDYYGQQGMQASMEGQGQYHYQDHQTLPGGRGRLSSRGGRQATPEQREDPDVPKSSKKYGFGDLKNRFGKKGDGRGGRGSMA